MATMAIYATSRFIGFSKEAKAATLTQFSASVKSANQQMYLLSQLPNYRSKPVSGRNDLTDVDVDGDGVFETRLKCGYLDNTDVSKRLNYSDDQIGFEYESVDKVYFGFGANNTIKTSQCYFMYRQAFGPVNPGSCSQEDPNAAPTYQLVLDDC